jgi:GT2 family glycosyltransferase
MSRQRRQAADGARTESNFAVLETALRRQQVELRELARAVDRLAGAGRAASDNELGKTELVTRLTVLLVTGGDPDLLPLDGYDASPFPQNAAGKYPGNPAASISAIAHLESLRSAGAQFLVFPQFELWWFDRYEGVRRHLDRNYRVVADDDACIAFDLRETAQGSRAWLLDIDDVIAEFEARFDRDPAILDWETGLDLASELPANLVFSPPAPTRRLPYRDGTIDIVFTRQRKSAVTEAVRVADAAVVTVGAPGSPRRPPRLSVEWKKTRVASSLPSVSIVIPSYNGVAYTEPCVLSLFETIPSGSDAEIVVVDDASTDDTQALLARLQQRDDRLVVIRNERNLGFLASCNRGAKEASGDIVVLLNNDTIALPGWLRPMLRLFRRHADAGAVVGKMLFTDGTLQEAGGVIFRDGRAANFGKWASDPEDPLFDYVREVDYGSGALLATWRSLFLEHGGFDARYRPIYCEDSDYCVKLWNSGWRVYYQPECTIVHVEGATSGTDEAKGDKRYQRLNHEKFVERWRDALRHHPPYPARFDLDTLHTFAVREAR